VLSLQSASLILAEEGLNVLLFGITIKAAAWSDDNITSVIELGNVDFRAQDTLDCLV